LITFGGIDAFPTNALTKADYTITFTPKTEIPGSGIIYVVFPSSDYKNFPAVPSCEISGGTSTLKSCQISGSIFLLETFDRITAGVQITIKIRNIINPQTSVC
jgi:hypothetical protein